MGAGALNNVINPGLTGIDLRNQQISDGTWSKGRFGVTPEQLRFAQQYIAANPYASDDAIRMAGFQQGIWDTPHGNGGWGGFLTQFLPMALSLATLSGGPLSGLLSGITGGSGAAGAAGGAASAIPAAAGDIVVTGPASAGLGGAGTAALGGGAVGQALGHSAGGASTPTPQAHNVAPTSAIGPSDIVVTGPRAPTGSSVIPPTVTPGDWVVTGNRPPMPDTPLPPNAAHTSGGTSDGGSPNSHETPVPSGSPPTSFPWRQLLRMLPGQAATGGGNSGSPTMANKTAASPFGGGTGAGASINIQGANRPSIYPWVSPGVTSSGQVQQKDQDGGYYG